jgi:hypothetical protein
MFVRTTHPGQAPPEMRLSGRAKNGKEVRESEVSLLFWRSGLSLSPKTKVPDNRNR